MSMENLSAKFGDLHRSSKLNHRDSKVSNWHFGYKKLYCRGYKWYKAFYH